MNKKELVFPGIILGIVLVVAVGLILTLPKSSTGLSSSDTASSTGLTSSSTTSTKPGTTTGAVTSYYPYGTLTLSIGEVAGFKDGLSVRPTNVVEDSRCPADVQCIQAGTVRITLKTSAKDVSNTETLMLGKSVVVNGDLITFTDVSPSRTKAGAPAFNSYRLTFSVVPATSADSGNSGGVATSTPPGPCYIGGCSREVCSDQQSQASSCIYRDQYACYKTATCERQASGSCGWTQTSELKSCLANPPSLQ